jgi:hypothetical protein
MRELDRRGPEAPQPPDGPVAPGPKLHRLDGPGPKAPWWPSLPACRPKLHKLVEGGPCALYAPD